MTENLTTGKVDRYTNINELCEKVRLALKRTLLPIGVLIALECARLIFGGKPGAGAFTATCIGSFLILFTWTKSAIGLPLLPMMAVQNLVVYAMPIIASHDILQEYPSEFVFDAGVEVLVYSVAMAVAWSFGMKVFHPSPPVSYALQQMNKEGAKGLARVGFCMIIASTAFQILEGLGLADALFAMLPAGTDSIIATAISVASASGFFLVSMAVGARELSAFGIALFWLLLLANVLVSTGDFILASAAEYLTTVAIGLFWGSGSVPWKYLISTMLMLSFLNSGKSTMRERYWESADSPGRHATLTELPSVFSEWIGVSYDAIVSDNTTYSAKDNTLQNSKHQTLLDRIDTLQNLLFVIDAEKTNHVSPLWGQSYYIIPPLLMPRIFWANKPRTHEGQIMLNVHFGRQDLESTFKTYIAWGFLPEAYGNFGPILGSVLLGSILGFAFAWIENFTARKLAISIEGFLSLNLLFSMMNSFEMVASIFVTSTFQSTIVIVGASFPFVRRMVSDRSLAEREEELAPSESPPSEH